MTATYPIDIVFRGISPSPTLEKEIRDRALDLGRFHPRIVSVRAVSEVAHRHQKQGRLFHVRLEISIPGEDVIIARNTTDHRSHEDPYVAVRDAFNAARRRLEDSVRRIRQDVKRHAPAAVKGRVEEIDVGPHASGVSIR